MTGESSPASGGAEDKLMELFKDLGREEILEVLSGGDGFCQHCLDLMQSRTQNIKNKNNIPLSTPNSKSEISSTFHSANSSNGTSNSTSWNSTQTPKSVFSGPHNVSSASSPASVTSSRPSVDITLNDGLSGAPSAANDGLPEEQKERIRVSQVLRKKDFVHMEKVDGRQKNVLQGLELHQRVFNADEQKEIVKCVYNLQRMGQRGQLRERTYSEPKKWMRGKGRVTIQFGCCYNYAVDKNGNPPGILREEEVDPLPPMFRKMIRRMVRWHVLPPTCVPNSCIVNIYDEGDCIPPHIDHHDFLRPFCTVSFLTECNILFGANLKIAGPGEFVGPVSIPLPVGSVLILSGNGADVAKHCVPGVPGKRISITFRKMDENKIPYSYSPDPELVGLKPLGTLNSPVRVGSGNQQEDGTKKPNRQEPAGVVSNIAAKTSNIALFSEKDDFPPLGGANFPPLGSASSANKQQWGGRYGPRR